MIIEKFDEKQILFALEENMVGKFAFLPDLADDMQVIGNEVTIIISHRKADMFNIICKAKTSELQILQKPIDAFNAQQLPFAWWVGFQGEPINLIAQLEKLNMVCTEDELGMAITLAELPYKAIHSELVISQAGDTDKLSDFVNILTELIPADALAIQDFYHRSSLHILENKQKFRLYIGYLNGKPIASSALFCHAGVAGVWDIITLPEARRKGIGTDMTLHALNEGKKLGYAIGVLTASDEGHLVYEKLGFKSLQQFYVYNQKSDKI